MKSHNTGSRAFAIAASLAFIIGGLFILLGDTITTPAKWTIYHGLTVLTVFGTIAAGHLMADAKRDRDWLSMTGFFVLFVAGTGLVVYSSVGRQAETTETSTLSAEATNKAIKDANADLTKARTMLAEAQADLAKETKRGGCGKTCDGIKVTIGVYEAAIKGHTSDLEKLGPQKPVNAEAEQMAKLAALFGADKDKATAVLILVKPFLWTLFFEVGSIVSVGFAFRHRKVARAQPANENVPAPAANPPKPRGSKRRATKKDETVVAFVDAFRLKHGRSPTYPEMRSQFHDIAKSTAWRYQTAA